MERCRIRESRGRVSILVHPNILSLSEPSLLLHSRFFFSFINNLALWKLGVALFELRLLLGADPVIHRLLILRRNTLECVWVLPWLNILKVRIALWVLLSGVAKAPVHVLFQWNLLLMMMLLLVLLLYLLRRLKIRLVLLLHHHCITNEFLRLSREVRRYSLHCWLLWSLILRIVLRYLAYCLILSGTKLLQWLREIGRGEARSEMVCCIMIESRHHLMGLLEGRIHSLVDQYDWLLVTENSLGIQNWDTLRT